MKLLISAIKRKIKLIKHRKELKITLNNLEKEKAELLKHIEIYDNIYKSLGCYNLLKSIKQQIKNIENKLEEL